jgi:hypothetical protein
LVALAGAVVFALVLQVSIAGVFADTRPQLALAAAPFDAGARTRLAQQYMAMESTSAARALALDAIRRDPMQPIALRVLAQGIPGSGPAAQSRQTALIMQSQRLSRRDLPTQMWLIDRYFRQGDAAATIRHFDVALRTSESARAGIFPMLEAAAAEPAVRRSLLQTLAERGSWTRQFAQYSVGSGRDLDFAVQVARLLLDPTDAVHAREYRLLLVRLAQSGRYSTAWDTYVSRGLAPAGAAAQTIRNGNFDAAEDGSPFDWTFAQEPELWASRERADGRAGHLLRVAAGDGNSGTVAWQVIRLASGPHQVRVRMGDVPAARNARPALQVDCANASGNTRLLTLVPDTAGSASREYVATTRVPAGCPFQMVSIAIAGDGPVADPSPWVDDLRID